MKRCTLLLLALSAMFMTQAQTRKQKAAALTVNAATPGVLLKVSKEIHDFGKIPQGKPVTYVFALENTSQDTLRIEHVQASCGCTTPEFKNDPVLPGSTTSLKVGYNAAAEGLFDKTITIYYNGGQTKVLHIRGNVWKTPDQPIPSNQALNVFKQL